MSRVIVGAGEVGSSLQKVIGGDLHDPPKGIEAVGWYDELHICFAYHGPVFLDQVRLYREQFNPRWVVIHSTVPVGTCATLKANHSPIRGVHPNLTEGIRTFVKYVSGPEAAEVAKALQEEGITTFVVEHSETTELLKLLDTTQYGMMILINRWCAEQARRFGADFHVAYHHANETYNAGYTQLGRPEVVRPFLSYQPGPIGGHCVRENARLLDETVAALLDASR